MQRRYFAGALLALPALSKAKSAVSAEAARQHFYQPDVENGSHWTGFRTSILLRREIAGEPCQLREIPGDEILRSGDRIQLRVQPNASGYLYVLTEDQDSNHHLLFPTLADDKGSNAADAFQMLAVPQVDWLRFDDEPGIDPVLVLFSGQPIATLEALRKKKDAVLTGREMRHLIAAQSGDDQQREIEESRNGSVPAIFSVAQFAGDTDLIMERIDLTHRPARKRG